MNYTLLNKLPRSTDSLLNVLDQSDFIYSTKGECPMMISLLKESDNKPKESCYELNLYNSDHFKCSVDELKLTINTNTSTTSHFNEVTANKNEYFLNYGTKSAFTPISSNKVQLRFLKNLILQAKLKSQDSVIIPDTHIKSPSTTYKFTKNKFHPYSEIIKTSPASDIEVKLLPGRTRLEVRKDKVVHNTKPKKNFGCEICQKKFDSAIALKGHITRKHQQKSI